MMAEPLLSGVTLSSRKPPLASSARHSPTVRSLPPAITIIWDHGTRMESSHDGGVAPQQQDAWQLCQASTQCKRPLRRK